MPIATDVQMQRFADVRLRPFAAEFKAMLYSAQVHKSLIGDVYARANSVNGWADGRTDGPPHLLQSGNGANPDDMLNFNAFVSRLIWLVAGEDTGYVPSGTLEEFAAEMRAQWAVLETACDRFVSSVGG